jgi:pimeloyl-ACP methyl ester carboxylesterase
VTGADVDEVLTADAFIQVVRLGLYSSDLAALLPYVVARADKGDFGPFAALGVAGFSKEFSRAMSIGLLFAIICAEDAPFIEPKELESSSLFAGPSRHMYDTCVGWPRPELPKDLRTPTVSDAPTLLLSGAVDPVTPPSWAEEAAKTLRHPRHVVVPNVGHGTSLAGCVPKLITRFVEKGSADDLDAKCVEDERRPPFVVGTAGVRP